ncbi:MAG: hypothetical protein U0487_02615 [Patescibacteria group bacterium]
MQAPTCGHDGHCNANACNVRYVGPTSQIADHHAMTLPRLLSVFKSAAVVTGLALVVTAPLPFLPVGEATFHSRRHRCFRNRTPNHRHIAKVIEQINLH